MEIPAELVEEPSWVVTFQLIEHSAGFGLQHLLNAKIKLDDKQIQINFLRLR